MQSSLLDDLEREIAELESDRLVMSDGWRDEGIWNTDSMEVTKSYMSESATRNQIARERMERIRKLIERLRETDTPGDS